MDTPPNSRYLLDNNQKSGDSMTLFNMRASRATRTLAALTFVIAATSTSAAFAATGSDALPRSVRFYFGVSAGSGDSQDFAGRGVGAATPTVLCSDADNSGGNNTYTAQLLWNRTLQPDDVLRSKALRYNQGLYGSATFSTYSSRQYHTYANWSAVPSAPDSADGYARDGYAGC